MAESIEDRMAAAAARVKALRDSMERVEPVVTLDSEQARDASELMMLRLRDSTETLVKSLEGAVRLYEAARALIDPLEGAVCGEFPPTRDAQALAQTVRTKIDALAHSSTSSNPSSVDAREISLDLFRHWAFEAQDGVGSYCRDHDALAGLWLEEIDPTPECLQEALAAEYRLRKEYAEMMRAKFEQQEA